MEKNNQENLQLAGRQYDVADYTKNDQVSSGLATTHEQVSDAYMEGEVKSVLDDLSGMDVQIPRQGY